MLDSLTEWGVESDTIGGRVRRLREAEGISMEALAQQIGKRGQTVWLIETGRTKNVPPDTVAALAQALGVSEVYLITGLAQFSGAKPVPPEILGLYQRLDPVARRMWLDIGRTLREGSAEYTAQHGEEQAEDTAAYARPELADEMRREQEDWPPKEEP